MKRLLLVLALLAGTAFANGVPPLHTADSGGFTASSNTTVISATTAGSLLVLSIYIQDTTSTVTTITSGSCTLPAFSNTPNSPKRGATTSAFLIYIPNVPASCADAIVNFSGSVTGAIKIAEYGGMATASPFDCGNAGTGSGTTLSSGSCTSGFTNETVVAGGGILTGSDTFTADGAYTVEIQRGGGSQSEFLEDKNVAAAGSQSASPTAASTGEWVIVMGVFKQTGSVAGSGNPSVAKGAGVVKGGSVIK